MTRVFVTTCVAFLGLAFAVAAQDIKVAQPSAYSSADLAAFHGSQNTLTNAISDAQQSTGGTVLEIRFAPLNGKPGFHTVVAKQGQVVFGRLQPPSKQVNQLATQPDWMLNWRQRTDVSLADKAKISLSQAIRTAESEAGAPAVAAGLARSASEISVHAYNVLLDQGGTTKRIAIDSNSGEVIQNPSQLANYP